jgi:hypothetical protein
MLINYDLVQDQKVGRNPIFTWLAKLGGGKDSQNRAS